MTAKPSPHFSVELLQGKEFPETTSSRVPLSELDPHDLALMSTALFGFGQRFVFAMFRSKAIPSHMVLSGSFRLGKRRTSCAGILFKRR